MLNQKIASERIPTTYKGNIFGTKKEKNLSIVNNTIQNFKTFEFINNLSSHQTLNVENDNTINKNEKKENEIRSHYFHSVIFEFIHCNTNKLF